MALVITAPEPIDRGDGYLRIFLAGAIDMGAAVDWQKDVIAAFADDDRVALYNPRRVAFTPDTLDEQIRWELEALDYVGVILMWLPGNAKAPVSMFEAGLYWQSHKLFIGADPAFYRRRNLELTGEAYGGPRLHATLDDLIAAVKQHFNLPVATR